MERDGHFAAVGAAFMLLLAGFAGFGLWLSKIDINPPYDRYEIRFTGRVRGLVAGLPVNVNGIRVGRVTSVEFADGDPNQIVAKAEINGVIPIRSDASALLEADGITNVYSIDISPGTAARPLLLRATPGGRTPVIAGRVRSLSELLVGGESALDQTTEALIRVNRLLSDENLQTFGVALSDVQAVTAEARDRRALLADTQQAVQSIDTAAREIANLSRTMDGLLDSDGRQALNDMAGAAVELQAAAARTRSLVTRLDEPATEFATTGLPQLREAISTLQSSASSLDRLVTSVESDPRSLLVKPPAKEMELEP